jgi:hypothetical protein
MWIDRRRGQAAFSKRITLEFSGVRIRDEANEYRT